MSELLDRLCNESIGLEVDGVDVDRALTIRMTQRGGMSLSARLECELSWERDGIVSRFAADEDSLSAEFGSLLSKRIGHIRVERSGRLEIGFTDAGVLVAEPDEYYEAWQLSGSGGLLIVCMPGGELAIWRGLV